MHVAGRAGSRSTDVGGMSRCVDAGDVDRRQPCGRSRPRRGHDEPFDRTLVARCRDGAGRRLVADFSDEAEALEAVGLRSRRCRRRTWNWSAISRHVTAGSPTPWRRHRPLCVDRARSEVGVDLGHDGSALQRDLPRAVRRLGCGGTVEPSATRAGDMSVEARRGKSASGSRSTLRDHGMVFTFRGTRSCGVEYSERGRSPRSRGAVGARRSRRLLSLRDTARAMSQENVEIVRRVVRGFEP